MSLENVHSKAEASDGLMRAVRQVTARPARPTYDASRRTRVGFLTVLVLIVGLAASLPVATAGTIEATNDGSSDGTLELVENNSTDETVTVDLRTSASNVAGYQTELRYDSSVLTVTRVDGVTLNDPVVNDTASGAVSFTQSQRQGVDAPTLATITFNVVDSGTTDIEFVSNKTLVNDETGSHLDVTLDELTVEGAPNDGGIGGGFGGGHSDDDTRTDNDTADNSSDNVESNDSVDNTDESPSSEQGNAPTTQPPHDDGTANDDKLRNGNESDTNVDTTPLFPSSSVVAGFVGLTAIVVRVLRWAGFRENRQ